MNRTLQQRLSFLFWVVAFFIGYLPSAYASGAPLSTKGILAIVIVAAALVLAALLILFFYCVCCKRKRTKNKKYEAVAMRSVSSKHKSSWEIPFSNIILSNESIGEGHFGDIHKCKIKNGLRRTTVAIAYLEGEAQIPSRDAFHTELDLMKKIGRHRNIVSLIATSYNKNESLYVAFDYASFGDLRSFLRKHRLKSGNSNISSLAPIRLLRFAVDVAKGMDYLTSLDIFHKELCARNVVVANGLIAKVSGIGLSKSQPIRPLYKRHGRQMSFRWSAIESWTRQIYTTKADIWSFGILLWEIVTLGGTPYHGVSNSNDLQQRLADGYRLDRPNQCTEDFYNHMLFCWQDSPEDRPTFADLLHDLSRMAEAKDAETKMFSSFKQEIGFIHAIIDVDKEDA